MSSHDMEISFQFSVSEQIEHGFIKLIKENIR